MGGIGNLRSATMMGAILATLVATTGITYGLLTSMVNVPTSGLFTSTNVGVYTTQQCNANLTSISWGSVRSGFNYTRVGYIRNNGNSNMTLSTSASNWNPSTLSSLLQLTWNYSGQKLTPGQVLEVTWTLTIPSGVTGYSGFGFDIIVIGTEA